MPESNPAVELERAPEGAFTAAPTKDAEARSELLTRAKRQKLGKVLPSLLVDHLLAMTEGMGFSVRSEGLDAILRRFDALERSNIAIRTKPAGSRVTGSFVVQSGGPKGRHYEVALRSLSPIIASCGCADFLRNSMGICKHVLRVLVEVTSSLRRFETALAATARATDFAACVVVDASKPHLSWNPVRPIEGPGIDVDRLFLECVTLGASRIKVKGFVPSDAGRLVPDRKLWSDPKARLGYLSGLQDLVRQKIITADPAPLALLENERSKLDRHESLSEAEMKHHLRGLKRKLFPYQIEGVRRAVSTGRLLLADDMGLGKTTQSIAAAHVLMKCGAVKRGVIVVPASLKAQWLREWSETTDLPLEAPDGALEARSQFYARKRSGFVVTNYEQVLRDFDAIRHFDPDMVILDEAQRIKNWATKTAAAVKGLNPRFRLVLTGTPMENRLAELASLMDFVDDTALEPKWRLNPVHSVVADGKREIVGAKGLETLRARLAPSMLRRVRTEVLDQLPTRTDTVVPVAITPSQREIHDGLIGPIAQLTSIAARRPLLPPEFTRLMQYLTMQRIAANGLALVDFAEVWPEIRGRMPTPSTLDRLASPKLLHLREIVASIVLDQGRRVVIFSQWRRMLELAAWAVSDLLHAKGFRAAFFTGQESLRQRTANVVAFHDDSKTRILFATDAGGVGLNLQRAATCCVNLEMPWNPAVLEQRIARIHRLGQKNPIDVYNLITENCIESRIRTCVADKRALFRGLFDGDSDDITFERSGSFLKTVSQLVETGAAGSPAPKGGTAPFSPEDESDADLCPSLTASEEARLQAALAPDAPLVNTSASELPSAVLPAGNTHPPATPESSPSSEPSLSPRSLADLVGRLSVQRTPNGGIAFEAGAADAEALANLFTSFATLLRSVR